MIKTVLWFFLLINILMFPPSLSISTSTLEDFKTTNPQKDPKSMYGMMMESNKPNTQRTYEGLHVVQHTITSQKEKIGYGGVNNIKGHHKIKKSASSYSIKSSSLFTAALKHLIPGMLMVAYFF
ncbi:hypothetical protein Lal_00025766 [Lupinus albus]|uniref:Uncharacterized protein n=1 Tax=Lupinus albus TaxID=3870 RepID=A0A6A4Q4H2_LUPAL|nr:hypothetical protein Lalb_Chr08g0234271 [Lupinus albus]KAF1870567.1 hypothetical protein Lal_00025766 [Lupinus albus]